MLQACSNVSKDKDIYLFAKQKIYDSISDFHL